jgi:hypothetical protein
MNCCDYAALLNSSPWPRAAFAVASKQKPEEPDLFLDESHKMLFCELVRLIPVGTIPHLNQ